MSADHSQDTGAMPAAGEASLQRERFFELLCESAAFALIATDDQLLIRFWNPVATQMFGGRPDLSLGRPVINIFPESVRPAILELLQNALREGSPGDLEFTQASHTGKSLLLTAVIAPIQGPDGRRLGASLSLRDITQRREMSRKLARGRRMASLGQMAGGVAHHFNSILGGAMTRLEFVLSMMKPGDRFQKDLERVLDAIGRAGRISGQLLTFAEGDHEPGRPGSLVDIVTGFIAEVSPDLAAQGIKIVADIRAIPAVLAESRRLRAVLSSLTQNAIDAMPRGGEIGITLSEENSFALLTFADSGSGIPEDKLERVFEPFFTTKGSLGGGAGKNTGLSLSVVHGFITDMGGRIEVFSAAGQGTRFEIRLPLAENGTPAT